MKTIGILCASDTELEPFFAYIKDTKITKKAMLLFHIGSINDRNIVFVYSGVGKVNAAIAAQILIDDFHVDMIMNAGTAGGINISIQLFDTIISTECAYHDVADDILTEFHPWMNSIYFPCDYDLLAAAIAYSKTSKYPIYYGKMVSGEQFIADNKRNEITQKYTPLCTDMETAAIAHVCYVNKIPFISVRTITDTASHMGNENFDKNCEAASHISADIVINILNHLSL